MQCFTLPIHKLGNNDRLYGSFGSAILVRITRRECCFIHHTITRAITSSPSLCVSPPPHTNVVLTRYKRRRLSRTVNLLTGQTGTHPDLIANVSTPANLTYLPPVTHWHPNLTINLVDDHTLWVPGSVPFPLHQCEFHKSR